MIIFVVEMLRNDSREEHSYVDGVYDDEIKAMTAATEHMNMRAGKYGAEIRGHYINGGEMVYYRKMSSDDAMAHSFRETAANLREMIAKTTGVSKSDLTEDDIESNQGT